MDATALRAVPDVPTPRTLTRWTWLSNLGARNPIPMLLRLLREDGDLVRLSAGPMTFILLQHPDHVGYVLQENVANYRKSFNYDAMELVLGKGLLTSAGDFWKRQRRMASPAFHRASLVRLAESM